MMTKMKQIKKSKSNLRVIAILGSDYHLRHKPSIARSAEPNWYAAMHRPLLEIEKLVSKHDCINCIAGDIFHRAIGNPEELIHFAHTHTPTDSISIAGQHDLPHHNYSKIDVSAYGLLRKFGVIHHLHPDDCLQRSDLGLSIQGSSWEQDIPNAHKYKGLINLILVHKYIWMGKHKYPGAKEKDEAKNHTKKLKNFGYDAAAFGDNHLGFALGDGKFALINCGSIMCTNSDQRKYKPMVGLLFEDGTIKPHYLDTSKDIWLDEKELLRSISAPNLEELMEEYKKLKGKSINFMGMLRRAMYDERLSLRGRRIVEEVVNTYDD